MRGFSQNRPVLPPYNEIQTIVDRAIHEDLAAGDPTTSGLIPDCLDGKAVIISRATGVLSGVSVALTVFSRIDPSVATKALMRDGDSTEPESLVAEIEGPVASILKAERTALNFLQRLSGIASEANLYVTATVGHSARILDTRKTTPGLRALEKYSVAVGGGLNHRFNLGDGVLIKDNHIVAMSHLGYNLRDVVETARATSPHTIKIEVEVENLVQAKEALEGGADILLLDNMDVPTIRSAVDMVKGKVITEASGGITLGNVGAVAETGVDFISIGALTHSPRALDMSLELL